MVFSVFSGGTKWKLWPEMYYGNLENIEIKGTLVQNILVGLIFRNNPPDVFLKYAANLQENTLVSLLHIFRTNFPKNTSGGLLLDIDCQ